ncbi:glycosyltransferase 87 family protein [Umezawaea endophytica]|uniref:Glycosyltransferase 87 family protein n=1 Tax=Umezawaea endophytica TaxID=1654476 RepID=A0A9X3AF17_9PSEU|nr:glycosyltransferase 87 family protein [Umezawaea endophytica]MCS7478112.1 glycosyltransferase 87 family protein [Umezawaea endophytica]
MVADAGYSVRSDKPTLAVVAAWLVVMVGTLVYVMLRPHDWSLDLRVYRNGGGAWLEGLPIYIDHFGSAMGGPDLPFTYPPIAVVLFSPLAAVPLPVAIFAIALLNLAALTALCLIAAVRVCGRGPLAIRYGLGAAVVSSVFDPVRETLSFGQINLLLAVLVLLDCLLARTRYPRGALIGLAAAIKLTPAVFVLFFLAAKQWRPAVTAFVSFLVFGAVGFAIMPTDARQFWFHALLDPGRVGRLTYTANQSLRGLVARLGLDGTPQVAAWVLLSLVVVVLAVVAAAKARRANDDVTAFLVVAVAGLLISPVSWGHHWIWIAPALTLFAVPALRHVRQFWWFAVPGVLIFLIGPHWLFPNDNDVERNWAWWQQVIGNAYVWFGLAVVVALALARRAKPAVV